MFGCFEGKYQKEDPFIRLDILTLTKRAYLLELSKGNAQVEILASFFGVVPNRSQVLKTHERRFDSVEHMPWCYGGRREVFACLAQILRVIRSKRIQNMHTTFGPH